MQEGDNEENYNKPLELCSELVLPRQVLMTGDAMLHMASLESLIVSLPSAMCSPMNYQVSSPSSSPSIGLTDR